MKDCNDPTLGERVSIFLIPIGCAVMDFLRRMRRPGATVTLILVTPGFGSVRRICEAALAGDELAEIAERYVAG